MLPLGVRSVEIITQFCLIFKDFGAVELNLLIIIIICKCMLWIVMTFVYFSIARSKCSSLLLSLCSRVSLALNLILVSGCYSLFTCPVVFTDHLHPPSVSYFFSHSSVNPSKSPYTTKLKYVKHSISNVHSIFTT